MLRISRKFSFARCSIAAIAVAISTFSVFPRALAQQQKQASQKTTLQLVEEGLKALQADKPNDALKAFNEIKNTVKWQKLSLEQKANLDYLLATAFYQKEDWDSAAALLRNFQKDYPNGTGDAADNKIASAKNSLADIYVRQQKWSDARQILKEVRKIQNQTRADRLKTEVVLAEVIQKEAEADGDAEKIKIALATAEDILKTAVAGAANTPEVTEVKQKLVQIYLRSGKNKEAEALKNEIDGSGSKDPASIIRSNIQGLSLGDTYFEQGTDSFDDEQRDLLFGSALERYQKVLRKDALVQYFDPALETARKNLDAYKKTVLAEPNDAQAARLEKLQETIEELEDYKKQFSENKDYDATISFRIGACLFLQKRYWEAYIAFDDVVKNHSDFSQIATATYYYILCLRMIGKDEEAQALCKEFLGKYPKAEETGEVALLLGQISAEHGDYAEAIKNYQWAKKNVPNLDQGTRASLDFSTIQAWFARCPWGILTLEEQNYVKENMGKPDYVPQISKATQETISLIDEFIKDYGANRNFAGDVETMQYCKGLLYFYSGSYREAIAALDEYIAKHPKGMNLPDARYRKAVTQFGVRYKDAKRNEENLKGVFEECKRWITDYFDVPAAQVLNENNVPQIKKDLPFDKSEIAGMTEAIERQLPEIYTLMGDAYKREAESIVPAPSKLKRVLSPEQVLQKERATNDMLRAYILAAKTSKENKESLDFVLAELDKTLPQRGEFERIRDIYQELYNWDPDAPDALNYLNKILNYTEKVAAQIKPPEGADPETVKAMKAEAIANAKAEAKKTLADAILRNFNDPAQENVELLIGDLAWRLSRQIKKAKKRPLAEGEEPPPVDPDAYTDKKAVEELFSLLKLDRSSAGTPLIGKARGAYARAMIYRLINNQDEANRYLNGIAMTYNADELSPTILGDVGNYLYARSKEEAKTSKQKAEASVKKAEEFYTYLKDNYRSSGTADTGFLGCGNIALDNGECRKAFEIFDDAIKNEVAYNNEAEIRLGRAQALIKMSPEDAKKLEISNKFEDAHKELNLVAGVKEWRGYPTAAASFYKGQLFEAQGKPNDALNNYRMCYISWKKYPQFAARAMIRAGALLEEKLGQPEEAGKIYYDFLTTKKFVENPDIADVVKEARSRALKRPYSPPDPNSAAN